MIPREADFTTNQENDAKVIKPSTTSWSRLKDPRIVRVSRALGGKDRHSKVCTVRGLRDRRVRLSVPTAIQLYDLQDRLGLNQPSKVVDWLLNAAKQEIDGLPPLQGSFTQNLEFGNNSQSNKQGHKITNMNWHDEMKLHPRPNFFWERSKDVSGETSDRNEEERQFMINLENQGAYFCGQNSASPSNPMHNSMLLNSFAKWDPSNLTLSRPPHAQTEDLRNFGFVYQPGMSTTQSYFPSQIHATASEFDPKSLNFEGSQLSNPSPVRPFPFQHESSPFTKQCRRAK